MRTENPETGGLEPERRPAWRPEPNAEDSESCDRSLSPASMEVDEEPHRYSAVATSSVWARLSLSGGFDHTKLKASRYPLISEMFAGRFEDRLRRCSLERAVRAAASGVVTGAIRMVGAGPFRERWIEC